MWAAAWRKIAGSGFPSEGKAYFARALWGVGGGPSLMKEKSCLAYRKADPRAIAEL